MSDQGALLPAVTDHLEEVRRNDGCRLSANLSTNNRAGWRLDRLRKSDVGPMAQSCQLNN